MNRLPESPRKMVAGLKLKRRNPRIAPANAIVITSTRTGPWNTARTNATMVENKADPAANPSSPSMRLKALVMASTQMTVNISSTNQGNGRLPKRTGILTMRNPPA